MQPPPSPIEYQAQQRREELREERDAKRERFAPPTDAEVRKELERRKKENEGSQNGTAHA